jgi:hypothetical protein
MLIEACVENWVRLAISAFNAKAQRHKRWTGWDARTCPRFESVAASPHSKTQAAMIEINHQAILTEEGKNISSSLPLNKNGE